MRHFNDLIGSDQSIALEHAVVEAGRGGFNCVTGSLFLAADAGEVWLQRSGAPVPPTDPIIVST